MRPGVDSLPAGAVAAALRRGLVRQPDSLHREPEPAVEASTRSP